MLTGVGDVQADLEKRKRAFTDKAKKRTMELAVGCWEAFLYKTKLKKCVNCLWPFIKPLLDAMRVCVTPALHALAWFAAEVVPKLVQLSVLTTAVMEMWALFEEGGAGSSCGRSDVDANLSLPSPDIIGMDTLPQGGGDGHEAGHASVHRKPCSNVLLWCCVLATALVKLFDSLLVAVSTLHLTCPTSLQTVGVWYAHVSTSLSEMKTHGQERAREMVEDALHQVMPQSDQAGVKHGQGNRCLTAVSELLQPAIQASEKRLRPTGSAVRRSPFKTVAAIVELVLTVDTMVLGMSGAGAKIVSEVSHFGESMQAHLNSFLSGGIHVPAFDVGDCMRSSGKSFSLQLRVPSFKVLRPANGIANNQSQVPANVSNALEEGEDDEEDEGEGGIDMNSDMMHSEHDNEDEEHTDEECNREGKDEESTPWWNEADLEWLSGHLESALLEAAEPVAALAVTSLAMTRSVRQNLVPSEVAAADASEAAYASQEGSRLRQIQSDGGALRATSGNGLSVKPALAGICLLGCAMLSLWVTIVPLHPAIGAIAVTSLIITLLFAMLAPIWLNQFGLSTQPIARAGIMATGVVLSACIALLMVVWATHDVIDDDKYSNSTRLELLEHSLGILWASEAIMPDHIWWLWNTIFYIFLVFGVILVIDSCGRPSRRYFKLNDVEDPLPKPLLAQPMGGSLQPLHMVITHPKQAITSTNSIGRDRQAITAAEKGRRKHELNKLGLTGASPSPTKAANGRSKASKLPPLPLPTAAQLPPPDSHNKQPSKGASQAVSGLSPNGLRWKNIGRGKPPAGTQLQNEALTMALASKTEFSAQEWQSFGVEELLMGHYVKSGDYYFRPAIAGAARKTARSPSSPASARSIPKSPSQYREWAKETAGVFPHIKEFEQNSARSSARSRMQASKSPYAG